MSATNQPQQDATSNQGALNSEPVIKSVSVGTLTRDTTSNTMSASSVVPISVKPVDRKTLEGSTPGDFRSQAADAVIPAQPGPRDQTGNEGA